MGGFDFAGGRLLGSKSDDDEEDKFERKQRLRTERRRPIQETLEELGEGRGASRLLELESFTDDCAGIYGPGYAKRRRERLKHRYGIDVPETPVSA